MSELTDEELHIVISAMRAMHQLKYIADIAVALKENNKLLEVLINEIMVIRDKMK